MGPTVSLGDWACRRLSVFKAGWVTRVCLCRLWRLSGCRASFFLRGLLLLFSRCERFLLVLPSLRDLWVVLLGVGFTHRGPTHCLGLSDGMVFWVCIRLRLLRMRAGAGHVFRTVSCWGVCASTWVRGRNL